ncbi:MAG: class I SAM-dependent methyltransferase, partial [Elusimicrobiota bacterium]|nr:class I SAM-dependent methyltransferase [Elusimicrobiota bacterium]
MLKIDYLQELRAKIIAQKNEIAGEREKWQSDNSYYYSQLLKSLKFFIPANSTILHVNCGTGFILERLQPSSATGVEDSPAQIAIARRKGLTCINFVCQNPEELDLGGQKVFDFILVSTIEELVDIKAVLDSVSRYADNHTRIIVTNYNYLWNPLVNLTEKLKLKYPQELHNWVSPKDMNDFLRLSGLDVIATDTIVLFPYYIPLLSQLLNRFVARLPFFNNFPLIQLTFARK